VHKQLCAESKGDFEDDVPLFSNLEEEITRDVISIIVALVTYPAFLAIQETIRQGQQKDRKYNDYRARRSLLVVSCVTDSK
jgi:hypothetical protein